MAIDAATTEFLARLHARPQAAGLSEMSVAEVRRQAADMFQPPDDGPEMLAERAGRIRVSGGHIPMRWLVPVDRPTAVIAWFHGGGWVAGDITGYIPFGRHLAARTGAAVCLAGYRKAPEFRYPTAADDACAALAWVASKRTEVAGAAVPVVVAGDSAGGNLAAVAALRARGRAFAPAAQLLVYPVTDCDLDTTSYTDPANGVTLTREAMSWLWDQYVPDAAARLDPDASPLREPDLRGASPAVIVTAEHDVLRDDGEIYATRLLKAKVPVRHRRFAGQVHGFATLLGALPAAEEALDWAAGALRGLLGGQVTPPVRPE